jgi:hypothetical protein
VAHVLLAVVVGFLRGADSDGPSPVRPASYGSGLPVEFVGDPAQALAQYGSRIVGQVDFEDGRVRPSASIDAALSVIVFKTDRQQVRIQANVVNVTDRLAVQP